MSTIYGYLDLDAIHAKIERALNAAGDREKIEIFADGQDTETPPLPFITYSTLREEKYKEYQRMKYIRIVEGERQTHYENPTMTEIQYSVHFEAKQLDEAKRMISRLYNYLTTDEFKQGSFVTVDGVPEFQNPLDGVGFTIISDVRPNTVPKNDFFERQFSFDVRWLWRDGIKITSAETIEEADDPTGGPVPDIS